MIDQTSPDIVISIRERWVQLTEDDVKHALKHRENFLDRLRHRHNLGLDDAEKQLEEFERRNPSLQFEKS
jgi:hypothetical protein